MSSEYLGLDVTLAPSYGKSNKWDRKDVFAIFQTSKNELVHVNLSFLAAARIQGDNETQRQQLLTDLGRTNFHRITDLAMQDFAKALVKQKTGIKSAYKPLTECVSTNPNAERIRKIKAMDAACGICPTMRIR